MKTKVRLNTEDRKFFSLLKEAIVSNPFLEGRDEIVAKILLEYPRYKKSKSFKLQAIVPILIKRIDKIERRGLKLNDFDEEDRKLIEFAFMLQVYLELIPDLDKLIQRQLSLAGTPADVPFAEKAITYLRSRGFSQEKSLHYFAIFYQLRRAFYFIDKALVGDSSSMKNLRFDLWNNVFTHDVLTYDQTLWNRMEDFSTILEGETGTGKGSAAAAIGRSAFIPFDLKKGQFTHNFNETFIAINLSQFPESLIESELFGHRKGSFTGAVEDHKGLFELCNAYGALFLDEIGDINISTQIKLLQILQERTFTPVGSHSQKRFKGRVIAATNRSIVKLRRQGKFRDDFFYRLCSDIITVPTLRQRIEETPTELEQMVKLLVSRMTGQENQSLTDMIIVTLKQDLPVNYPWPGNVRELEQAVRSIILKKHYYGDAIVIKSDLEDEFVQKLNSGTLKINELLNLYCTLLYKRVGTYKEVALLTGLDSRTVKKYIQGSVK